MGEEEDPGNRQLPYPDLTPNERQWTLRNTASAVNTERRASRTGGFGSNVGALVYRPTYVSEALIVPTDDVWLPANQAEQFAAYLVVNYRIVKTHRPTWSLTAQATHAVYVTALSFRELDSAVTALRGQFTEGQPGSWDRAMTDVCTPFGIDTDGLDGKDLVHNSGLGEDVKDAVQKLAQVLLNHAVLVTTHIGTATTARVTKFNNALTAEGMAAIAATPEQVQEAWTVTRPISQNGKHDERMISFVTGVWSGLSEMCQNFTRQSVWRTIAPLMVTAHLMCQFREVGWARLLSLCPGVNAGLLEALEAVKAQGAGVVYTRPECIAQAKYKRVALASILIGQVAYPTLQDLNGRFRNAPLSASLRHWIRENKARVTQDQPDDLTDEFLEKVGSLVQQIGAVGGME
ncbi:hypothetical protein FJT64_011956 [Amphibalanus amphitrite]|uniref:Uncharacterized protein n=1 Tax=Amphibalanus amphitrite TaxID=1232801 RepID=A0A6A4VH18_AMPAM|nr:hypothetical protein FJT64_011956 [Amphibalanus amphitrite]